MSFSGARVRLRYLGRLAEFSPSERTAWLCQMRGLWIESLRPHLAAGSDWPGQFWDSMEDTFASHAFALVASSHDEMVGFQLVSHRRLGRQKFVVLQATAIRSDLQGASIGYAMTAQSLLRAFGRAHSTHMHLVIRIFNPLALSGFYRAIPDRSMFYPAIDPQITVNPVAVDAIARYVEAFCPEQCWTPGPSLLRVPSEKPVPVFASHSGSPIVDRWWDQHLRDGGASVLCLQEVTFRTFSAAIPRFANGVVRGLGLSRRGARVHRRTGDRNDSC